jgi:hypothetical protein
MGKIEEDQTLASKNYILPNYWHYVVYIIVSVDIIIIKLYNTLIRSVICGQRFMKSRLLANPTTSDFTTTYNTMTAQYVHSRLLRFFKVDKVALGYY